MKKDDKIVLLQIGTALKKARKRIGYSQQDVADYSDVQRYQISLLERGRLDIQTYALVKIIWTLGVDPNTIIPSEK